MVENPDALISMLTEELTLQCSRCVGYFFVVAVPGSKVRCPHCDLVAVTGEFSRVQSGELASGAVNPPQSGPLGENTNYTVDGRFMQFGCPHCERAMKMMIKEAGGLADCPHCGLEIISPDPANGTASRLTDASRRQLGNLMRFKSGNFQMQQEPFSSRYEFTPPVSFDSRGKSPHGDDLPAEFPDFLEDTPGAGMPPAQQPARNPARSEAVFPAVEPMSPFDHAGHPEEEDSAHDPGLNEDRGRVFAIAAGFLLLFLGGLFIALELRRWRQEKAPGITAAETAGENPKASGARHEDAFALVKEAAAAGSLEQLLPLVRSRRRVEPLIREYYRRRPVEPVELVAFEDPVITDAAGIRYLQLRVVTAAGDKRSAAVEVAAAGGMFFDWELWVNIAALEWSEFLDERSTERRTLRVCITRSLPINRYFEDAGLKVQAGYGVRVRLAGSNSAFYAVLPRGDPESEAVWQATSWEPGRRVVADLSFPEAALEPGRIMVHRIRQSRWLIP